MFLLQQADAEFGENILTIIAVANLLMPLIFGFALWKLSQVFVLKIEMIEYRKNQDNAIDEIRSELKGIDNNVIELLQRTAGLRWDRS